MLKYNQDCVSKLKHLFRLSFGLKCCSRCCFSASDANNAWFNFTCYHPPPGNPGDKSSPSAPGVGNCLKPSCPGGRGAGQIENNFLLLSQYVTSQLMPDRVEKTAYFQGESLEFVADWLEKKSLKIKICIRRYFYFNLLNECAFDAYSNRWRSSQTKIYFFGVFMYILRRLK